MSSQVTLNDPGMGRPCLPEEEHSNTVGVPVCIMTGSTVESKNGCMQTVKHIYIFTTHQ